MLGLSEEDPTAPSPPHRDTHSLHRGRGERRGRLRFQRTLPGAFSGIAPRAKGTCSSRPASSGPTAIPSPSPTAGSRRATISQAFQQLGLQYGHTVFGNLLDSELPFVPRDSTLVTIFAGGNDVNVITAALGGGAGAANQTAFIDQQVQNFRPRLHGAGRRHPRSDRRVGRESSRSTCRTLRGCRIVASAPRSAQRQAAQRAAVGMTTTAINAMTSRGVRVVDLMCLAQLYAPASLSSDGFHPSDAGYALIAAEVVRAVTSESFPAPQASCPQMSM